MVRKPAPVKFCRHCEKRLVRKRINGRLEDYGTFKRRLHCDMECMAKGMMMEIPTEFAISKRAEKEKLDYCEECGSPGPYLGVHHKDGNRQNNEKENLETLCASCHAKLHWQTTRRGLPLRDAHGLPLECPSASQD